MASNRSIVLCVSFLFVSVQLVAGARSGISCSIAGLKDDAEKSLAACMFHNPGLMFEIMENFQHPDNMMKLDFVCKNENEAAKLLHCMIDKFSTCLPAGTQKTIGNILPSEKHWEEIIGFVCQNKGVFGDQCMAPEDSQNFLQCYLGKLQGLTGIMQGTEITKSLNPLMCNVIRWDQQCFKLNAGKCSANFIKLTTKLIEMVFTVPDCPSKLVNTKLNDSLSSLLIHGQPLLFQPKYNVVRPQK